MTEASARWTTRDFLVSLERMFGDFELGLFAGAVAAVSVWVLVEVTRASGVAFSRPPVSWVW